MEKNSKVFNSGYHYKLSATYDTLLRSRLEKLKELISILNENIDDAKKAQKFRRIYPNYKEILTAYYSKVKVKNGFMVVVDDEYKSYRDQISKICVLYKEFEEKGLFNQAKENDKFLLKQNGNLDSRYIINAYIFDTISYDLDIFLERYKINKTTFDTCVSRIKNNDEELYAKYLNKVKSNKVAQLVVPIHKINNIVEGITSGKTIEGNKFDIYEFYKLAPFRDKDFDKEVRLLSKDYSRLNKYSIAKRNLFRVKKQKDSSFKQYGCTYAEKLYLFVYCYDVKKAAILKKWMEDNNVKNLTPIHKGATLNFYNRVSENDIFTKEDAENIFETMDQRGLPYLQEVYSSLKKEKTNKKKTLVLEENK